MEGGYCEGSRAREKGKRRVYATRGVTSSRSEAVAGVDAVELLGVVGVELGKRAGLDVVPGLRDERYQRGGRGDRRAERDEPRGCRGGPR